MRKVFDRILSVVLFSCFMSFAVCAQEKASEKERVPIDRLLQMALENNYDIQLQKAAILGAAGQLRQVKGALDLNVGADTDYSLSNSPVDSDDPSSSSSYSPIYSSEYLESYTQSTPTFYTENTQNQRVSASVFAQKKFAFGLNSKLTFSLQRDLGKGEYSYNDAFMQEISNGMTKKIEDPTAKNTGTIGLEMTLPLLKSFGNSILEKNISAAEDNYKKMNYLLEDTVSKTILNVTSAYSKYLIAYSNLTQSQIMLETMKERTQDIERLMKAGLRSKSDLLMMQVNICDTERNIATYKTQLASARLELLNLTGADDTLELGEPVLEVTESFFEEYKLPDMEEFTEERIEQIADKRPSILALRESLKAAEENLSAARADRKMDIDLKFGIGVTGTRYGNEFDKFISANMRNVKGADIKGGVGIQARIGNNEKKGAVDNAEADVKTARIHLEREKNNLATQLKNSAESLYNYHETASGAKNTLELQKELYDSELKRFKAGLITTTDFINQDTKYLQAQRSYNEVLSNYFLEILNFKYFSGELVEISDTGVNSFYK